MSSLPSSVRIVEVKCEKYKILVRVSVKDPNSVTFSVSCGRWDQEMDSKMKRPLFPLKSKLSLSGEQMLKIHLTILEVTSSYRMSKFSVAWHRLDWVMWRWVIPQPHSSHWCIMIHSLWCIMKSFYNCWWCVLHCQATSFVSPKWVPQMGDHRLECWFKTDNGHWITSYFVASQFIHNCQKFDC